MNLLKFSIGLTLFTSTFFAACKKDDDDDDGGSSGNACKVSSAQYSLGQNNINATYTYNGNQVTKVQFPTFNYTLDYTGNNISKRNYFFSAGAKPEIYDQVSYNTDGTISRIESYADTSGSSYLPAQRIDFSYSGGKLSKTSFYELDGAISDLYLENTYTYTGNNITSLSTKEITDSGDITGTVSYTYDSNPNYFKKQNSQAFMIDLLFNPILLDDGSFLPLVFSENNVTKISTEDITYETDTRQNVTNLKIAGTSIVRYTYQCP